MTKVKLLENLTEFTHETLKDLYLPTAPQKGAPSVDRRFNVYMMRIPESGSETKKAPCILHQIVEGLDSQETGQKRTATATVRSVFLVYGENEEDGAMNLLLAMERFRIGILKLVYLGKQFKLDLSAGMTSTPYSDNTAPYFIGEIITTWELQRVEPEVKP